MRTALQIDITFEQILDLVKRLLKRDKLKLTRELEKEGIDNKLSKLLSTFKTDKLSTEDIDSEVETVRQQLYEQKKR